MNTNSLFIGKNIISLEVCSSTNNYLKEMLSNTKPLPEGTAILAEDQPQGRGQQGAQWFTEPGKNVTTSILLFPTFLKAEHQFTLNMAISLAVRDTIASFFSPTESIKIKWPNDIYVNDLKIGGILIENTVSEGRLRQSIIGIGINVNTEQFPINLQHATSLSILRKEQINKEKVLTHLFELIEKYYLKIKFGNSLTLQEEYVEQLWAIGIEKKIKVNNQYMIGEIKGVNNIGQLEILINNKLHLFNNKEVEFIL